MHVSFALSGAEANIRPRGDTALYTSNASTPDDKGECTTFAFNQTTFGGFAVTDYTGG